MQRRIFIKSLTAFGTLGGLAGCASSPLGQTISTLGDITLGSGRDFNADYVRQLPYASIIVSRSNNKKVLLVLGKVEDRFLHWFSTDRSVLVTRNGRLVRTVGLDENLVDTHFIGQDFSEIPEALSLGTPASWKFHRSVDLQPGNRFGILVDSTLEKRREERITILDQSIETTLWIEHNQAKALSWTFENQYWMDSHGLVWKSIQHISPKQPTITIEIAKPFVPAP